MKTKSPPPILDGAELLNAAIEASGMSGRKFCRDVLDVDERTGRRWKAGEYLDGFKSTPRILCAAIVKRPHLAKLFAKCLAEYRPPVIEDGE